MPHEAVEAVEAGRRRLIVIDDDKLFLRVFAVNLEAGGYAPQCFDDPEQALQALTRGTTAEACVVDLDMPRLDGLAFLQALRGYGVTIPVIFVTSNSSPIFEEEALRAGAVDFIDKGRGPAIILHRIGMATQRQAAIPPKPDGRDDMQLGKLLLRCESRRAYWNGTEIPLSRSEFEVILLLAGKAGTDVGYREIYDIIKGDGFLAGAGEDGYRANVRATIKRIRRKFESLDPDFSAIENYPGFGYRWRHHG
jgi:two-component system, OmpR family, response regulator ChvI